MNIVQRNELHDAWAITASVQQHPSLKETQQCLGVPSVCVNGKRQIACLGISNQRCENNDNYHFVWSLMQHWDDPLALLHVQYFEWSFSGPELNVEQTDTQWASALKKLALFYLTAVQMWTDGIILATIWLWHWSPLLKRTELSKKRLKRFSSQPGNRNRNKLRAAGQNAISTSTIVLIVHIKLPFIKSRACKLQDKKKGDSFKNRAELQFLPQDQTEPK